MQHFAFETNIIYVELIRRRDCCKKNCMVNEKLFFYDFATILIDLQGVYFGVFKNLENRIEVYQITFD